MTATWNLRLQNHCIFIDHAESGQVVGQSIGSIEASAPRIIDPTTPRWTIEALWRHADGSYLR